MNMGGPEDEEARCTGCVDDERGVADRVQEQEEQDREIDCLKMLRLRKAGRGKVNVRLGLPKACCRGRSARYINQIAVLSRRRDSSSSTQERGRVAPTGLTDWVSVWERLAKA